MYCNMSFAHLCISNSVLIQPLCETSTMLHKKGTIRTVLASRKFRKMLLYRLYSHSRIHPI